MEHFRVTRFAHTPVWSMKLCFSTFDTSFFFSFFLLLLFCSADVSADLTGRVLGQRTGRPVVLNVGRQVKRAEISWTLRHAENVTSIHFFPLLPPQKVLFPPTTLLLDFSSWTWPFLINYHKNPSGKLVLWFFHSRIQWSGLMHSENIIFSPLFIASSKNAGY